MTREKAIQLAEEAGFSHWGIFPADKLRYLKEVRDMCAADRCQMYDRCWSCPPACGTLDEIREKTKEYDWGLLVQSTGQMEDDFDVEMMMETEELQKEHLKDLCERIGTGEKMLPMASGACTICKECTYPDAPCRFPERMHSSMEAYGLVVSEVCQLANVPYYYGPLTITYTSCILFPEE